MTEVAGQGHTTPATPAAPAGRDGSAAATEPTGQTRVTIAQVADLAGVSPTTVSHVLSGKRVVKATTRGTVQEAIRRLGYRPNNVARSLRTRRSHIVAVVLPDLTNSFYGVLTRGLADAVDQRGYGTYLCNTDGLADRETKFLEDVVDRGADGIVLASVDSASTAALGPADLGTPVVCVGGSLDHPLIDMVTADDRVGSHAATAHLIARGVTRVAMIQGPATMGTDRVDGFRQAMAAAGLEPDPDLMVEGDWTRQGGYRAMQELLSQPNAPDSVFCANDLTAIGALEAVRERGLSVPDDVALVGFDDVDAATIVSPALTTVRNPAYDIGRQAGELLMSRMLGEFKGNGRTVVLPCPLVPRDSA
ncbi:MAG TPA: LacI family DNA-binding transcriptional regulator [Nocardioidaceae bacterium]|jgi:LacI family transcriptional regulator